jgi:pyruvate formate lyase activating enzyme
MKGRVFDISQACVDDGPGLRTTVFLKGCHLTCPWCHNIEGKSFHPEIALDSSKCIGCGQCQETCERTWTEKRWRDGCTACGRCVETCPSGARRLVGREMTPEELVAEVSADLDFFAGTGGGVTFSGGEPLAQPGFLFACARKLKEKNVHLAVETSGYWPDKHIEKLNELFDLVLFDLKHVDSKKCRQYLGTGSQNALSNLKTLLESRLPVEVRITLIPGFNDSDADLKSIAGFLNNGTRRPPVLLQPFHRLAVSKQALFDRPYPYADYPPLSPESTDRARQILGNAGISTI